MGIIIKIQYKDPYKPISIMECHIGFESYSYFWGGYVGGGVWGWLAMIALAVLIPLDGGNTGVSECS